MAAANGLIWWSTPAATVGLVIDDNRVIDCPPYARKWALGRDARQLWRDGKRQGAELVWLPQPADPDQPWCCPSGHPFTPGGFTLSWVKCSCAGTGAAEGHQKLYCGTCDVGVMPLNHVEG